MLLVTKILKNDTKSNLRLCSNRACLINSVTGHKKVIFGSHFFNFYHLNSIKCTFRLLEITLKKIKNCSKDVLALIK